MRVLLVADVVGGVRTFIRELAPELAARDVELHLALIGRGSAGEWPDAISCEVRDLRLEWMPDPWEDIEAASHWVENLCELHRPDVLHMNSFTPVLPGRIPVLLTVHSCVLTWWRAVHRTPAPPNWRRYEELVRGALDRADLVAAPTRALLKDVQAVYGHLPEHRVIPNGRRVAEMPRIASGRPLVVSAGRLWDEAKNVALLARAAPAIRGRVVVIGPQVRAEEAAGGGGLRSAGGLGGRGVEPVGELCERDVLGWFSSAAVFAEPARYEPFGLAALEAALCGCALVLGDIPSLRELWGGAASFVPPDDPEALAYAINSLLEDPQERRVMAERARGRARRYSPMATAEAYLKAYLSLKSGRSSPPSGEFSSPRLASAGAT